MWLRSLYYVKKAFDTLQYGDKISRFQRRQLRKILNTCQDLPFYQDRWDGEPSSPSDSLLGQIPLLEHDAFSSYTDIRPDSTISGPSRETSGTSGQPTRIKFTNQANDWFGAIHARTLYLHGYRPRKRITQYWRSNHEQRSWIGKRMMPKQHITPDTPIPDQVETLRSQDPDIIYYFPHTLLALCKLMRRRGITPPSPDRVITYGETLTQGMRTYIHETLDAPVRDQYGTTEFGTIGWDCPDGGYHLAEDVVYPEVCDGDGTPVADGARGQLILTGLVNTATPLVRYQIGDIVERDESTCGCSTGFLRIKNIQGRQEDAFRNAEDTIVFPTQVGEQVAMAEDILFAQVTAHDDRYVFRYVPNSNCNERAVNQVASRLEADLALEPLAVEAVDRMPSSVGGKVALVDNKQGPIPPTKLF